MTVIQPVNVPQPVKLTIEQFRMLDDSGAFDGYAKTELIEGAIYAMNAQYAAHAVAKSRLARRLGNALEQLGAELDAVVEGTVEMPPASAPEPDIALAKVTPGERSYIALSAVALVVEVADASVAFDLKDKAQLYSGQGVPEYWVLDLNSSQLHQFWDPSPAGYGKGRSVPVGRSFQSVTIPGLGVESDGLI
jgi:Uma2 family endonuclease